MKFKSQKIKNTEILKKSVKIFFGMKNSYLFFTCIIVGVFIAKLARVLNFNNDIKIDTKSTKEIIGKTALLIIINDIIELAGYRITDYLTDVCFVKQQSEVGVLAFRTILEDSSMDLDLKSGKIQYFIRQGGIGLAKLMKNVVFLIFTEVIEMILILIFISASEDKSAFILTSLFFCSIFVIFVHLRVTEFKIKCKRESNLAFVECDKVLYELILNYDTIKSSNTEENEVNKYYSKLKMYENAYNKYGKIEDLLDFFHGLCFILTKGALMLYIYEKGSQKLELASSFRRIMKSTKSIDTISSKTGTIYRKIKESLLNSRMALEYIYDEQILKGEHQISNFNDNLVFQGVNIFAKKVKILNEVNFEIKKGKKVAIVGKNGQGKSTILKTLLKLKSHTGKIEIDGIDIKKVADQSYKSLFSYLPQNNFLFDDTIRNNILYGVKEKASDELIFNVCEQLNLHESIMKLPNQYDTPVGERGDNLSGGQRQKILLARAFLRNAQIFLFDEPFNNLDKESSDAFIKMVFGPVFGDKTVLMVIHNYDIIDLFDQVIDIDKYSVLKQIIFNK